MSWLIVRVLLSPVKFPPLPESSPNVACSHNRILLLLLVPFTSSAAVVFTVFPSPKLNEFKFATESNIILPVKPSKLSVILTPLLPWPLPEPPITRVPEPVMSPERFRPTDPANTLVVPEASMALLNAMPAAAVSVLKVPLFSVRVPVPSALLSPTTSVPLLSMVSWV